MVMQKYAYSLKRKAYYKIQKYAIIGENIGDFLCGKKIL
jgi:hypothetical protein